MDEIEKVFKKLKIDMNKSCLYNYTNPETNELVNLSVGLGKVSLGLKMVHYSNRFQKREPVYGIFINKQKGFALGGLHKKFRPYVQINTEVSEEPNDFEFFGFEHVAHVLDQLSDMFGLEDKCTLDTYSPEDHY